MNDMTDNVPRDKQLVAIEQNMPRSDVTNLVLDATMSSNWLELLVGRRVRRLDVGRVGLQSPVIQYPRDITRGTSPRVFQSLVRGTMALWPAANNVGLIVHSVHKNAAKDLGPGFAERVHRVAYFHGGQERSDNLWYEECDLIIICGTPRVPPAAIRQRLLQASLVEAAMLPEPTYGEYKWLGRIVTGKERVLAAKRYDNKNWDTAYQEQVHALLRQAVGRGRGTLEDGVETLVLTNEPLGYPLLEFGPDEDSGIPRINSTDLATLQAIRDLSPVFPNNNIVKTGDKTDPGIKTNEIAARIGRSPSQTREKLVRLDALGLVIRNGTGKFTSWQSAT